MKKCKVNDKGEVIARGLAMLVVDKRLRVDECNDVTAAFAEIVRACASVRKLEQRIVELERELRQAKAAPKLKEVA
jgi:hypothetical protein